LLRDDETLQKRRGTQRLAEPIAAGEGEVDCFRAVEQKLEEHPLLIASVADLANVEPLPVVVGKKRIVEAPLREDVVLHPNGEEVCERASAEAHDVGNENRLPAAGCRLSGGCMLQSVDDGGGIEADVPWTGVAKSRRDVIDCLGGREIEIGFDGKPVQRVRQKVCGLGRAQRRARSERFDLSQHRDVGVDRCVARDRPELFTRPSGDSVAARCHVDVVDSERTLRNESAAQQFEDVAARETVLAQSQQRGDGASEPVRDQRSLVGD